MGLGITHLVWADFTADNDSLAGELLFQAYARLHGARRRTVGAWTVAAVPAEEPRAHGDGVVVVGCTGAYQTGLYRLADLVAPRPPIGTPAPSLRAPRQGALEALLPEAWAVAVEASCGANPDLTGFVHLTTRQAAPAMQLWTRPPPP